MSNFPAQFVSWYHWASQVVLAVKNPSANAGGIRDVVHPWVGKIPWGRAPQPTPVLLPGESHGRGSFVGYSPRVEKRQD